MSLYTIKDHMRKFVLVIVGITSILMAIQIYLVRGEKKGSSRTSSARYLPWIIITLMIVLNIVIIHQYKKQYGLAASLPKPTKTGTGKPSSNSEHGSTTIEIYNTKPQPSTSSLTSSIQAPPTTDDVAR